jgi:hypothetical protein
LGPFLFAGYKMGNNSKEPGEKEPAWLETNISKVSIKMRY